MGLKHLDLALKRLYLSRNMKLKIKNLILDAARSAHQNGELPSADIMEAENVADILEKEHLGFLAQKVNEVYEADSESRKDWMEGR